MAWRRVLIYATLFVLVLLVGTYIALTRSGFARSLVLESLDDLIGGRLQLGSAEVDPIGGEVRLENVRLSPHKDPSAENRDSLKLPEVIVGVSMNPLSAPGEVQRVILERPELDIDLAHPAEIDFEELFKLKNSGSGPARLPSISIRDMTVRVHLPGKSKVSLVLHPIQLELRPRKDDDSKIVVTGSCPNPLGTSIEIRGSGDLEKQHFRLLAEAAEFEIDSSRAGDFGEGVAEFIEKHGLRGKLNPTLWLAYPSEKGELDGGIRATFKDLEVVPPPVPYRFDKLYGHASMQARDGGTFEVSMKRDGDLGIDGGLRIANLAGPNEIELRIQATGLAIDDRLAKALRANDDARRIFEALNPKGGTAKFWLHVHEGLRSTHDADGRLPRFQLDVDVRDAGLTFVGLEHNGQRGTGFPYALENVRGRVEVRDEFITIRDVRADGVAGGRVEFSGQVDSERDELDLHVVARELPFRDEVRSAIAEALPGGEKIYDEFSPRGTATVETRVRKRRDDDEASVTIEIEPERASASWNGFPYRVEDISGKIRIAEDLVAFHLRGERQKKPIEARGRIAGKGKDQSLELRIEGKAVPFDEELRSALIHRLPDAERIWAMASPRGRFDLDLLVWQADTSTPTSYDLRADLLAAKARFEDFPAEISDLKGPIVVHADGDLTRVEVLGVSGRSLDARLLTQGVWRSKGNKPSCDLTVVADGVELNDELVEILDQKKIIRRATWKTAKASGRVDAGLEIVRKEDEDRYRNEIYLDLRDFVSNADFLPDRLSRVSGEVRIDADRVIHFKNLEGRIGESKVTCPKGKLWHDERYTWLDIELSAERYPVDARLARMLSGDVRRAYLARNTSGAVSVVGLELKLGVPHERPPRRLRARDRVRRSERSRSRPRDGPWLARARHQRLRRSRRRPDRPIGWHPTRPPRRARLLDPRPDLPRRSRELRRDPRRLQAHERQRAPARRHRPQFAAGHADRQQGSTERDAGRSALRALRLWRSPSPRRRIRARRRQPRTHVVAHEDGAALPRSDRRQGAHRPRPRRPELARPLGERRCSRRLARRRAGIQEHLRTPAARASPELRLGADRPRDQGWPHRNPAPPASIGAPARRRTRHARSRRLPQPAHRVPEPLPRSEPCDSPPGHLPDDRQLARQLRHRRLHRQHANDHALRSARGQTQAHAARPDPGTGGASLPRVQVVSEATRFLALDIGERRTGVAATDWTGTIPLPLPRIDHKKPAELLEAVAAIVSERETQAIVVGVPYGRDGEVGPQAAKILAVVEQLRTRLPETEIRTEDEAHSTDVAHAQLKEQGVKASHRKRFADSLAALEILRRHLRL